MNSIKVDIDMLLGATNVKGDFDLRSTSTLSGTGTVRYDGMTILRKLGYGYGVDIFFINFLYILLCTYFSNIVKHM